MSRITPIGYTESKMGKGMAIFFLIVATILSVLLVNGGMEIKFTVFLFAVAIVLGGLSILSDVASNKKNKNKIEHMKKMLKCPYVIGKVVEVKKYKYGLNGKITDIKPGYYVKSKYCVYKIFASFIDADNNEKIVESEVYAFNPKRDRVRIYYSDNNEYWIDVND